MLQRDGAEVNERPRESRESGRISQDWAKPKQSAELEFTSSAQDSYQGLRKEHPNDIVKRPWSKEQMMLAQKQHSSWPCGMAKEQSCRN